MSHDREKGAFSADIPEDAIADALAAVERRPAPAKSAEVPGAAPAAVEVEVEAPGAEAPAPAAPAAPDEVALLRRELELSQEHARKVFEQLKEEHDRLLRAAADLDNHRKRAARERDEVQKYGNERLVKDLLPVLDALRRALAAASADDPLRAGVEMTRRLFDDALSRYGVKSFSAKGQPFDARYHEALMTVATDAAAAGTVVEEEALGFFLHERLLRPAAVVVAVAPPLPPAPAAAPADGPAPDAGAAPGGGETETSGGDQNATS